MTAILDAGALIALARSDRVMWALLKREFDAGRVPRTNGGVVGQVWRDGARQAQLARALTGVETVPLDETLGRRAGETLAAAGTADVIDAALVVIAEDGDVLYSSDIDDLTRLAVTRALEVDIVAV